MKLLKILNASPPDERADRDCVNSMGESQTNSFNPPRRTQEPRPQAAVREARPALAKESPTEIQKAKNAITQLQAALVANETSQIPDRMPAK